MWTQVHRQVYLHKEVLTFTEMSTDNFQKQVFFFQRAQIYLCIALTIEDTIHSCTHWNVQGIPLCSVHRSMRKHLILHPGVCMMQPLVPSTRSQPLLLLGTNLRTKQRSSISIKNSCNQCQEFSLSEF